MTTQDQIAAIEKIKKTQENLVVFGGILVGFILLVYFFTFPQLIDHGATGALWFQGITTILSGFYFVYLKKVSYFFTRLLLGRDPVRKNILQVFSPADLLKDNDVLIEQLATQNKGA